MDQAHIRAFRAHSRTMVRELGFLEEQWAPAELPHGQIHVLLELDLAGVLRPGELADRLRSDPAVVSRGLARLSADGLVEITPDPEDRRGRRVVLAAPGRAVVDRIHQAADRQVDLALSLLPTAEQDQVLAGMAAYAKALIRSRRQAALVVRPLTPQDDPGVRDLIRTVMPEFGAEGPGFALSDPEVDAMSTAYLPPAARYWIVVDAEGRVLGGAGYAPLEGADAHVCELRKMYFLPELRGMGMGARLLNVVLAHATEAGYRTCYLETLVHMDRARRLYEAFGFARLAAPLGHTGHHGCDTWYARGLGVGS